MKLRIKILCYLIFNSALLFSQPLNDNCANVSEILISESGFGFGNFVSQKSILDNSTKESGEIFHQSIIDVGNNDKTVWYKFQIPTARNIEIILKQQDSVIPQLFVGFTIYKTTGCDINIGNIAVGLTPIVKFGSSGNSCLQAGTYYIQVCAKQRTKGEIWIDLDVKKPINQSYDNYSTPYDFGVMNNQTKTQLIDIQCLTTERNENNNINNPNFNKSFWIKIEYNVNSVSDILILGTDQDFMFRFFSNMPNIDSINSTKPFQLVKLNSYSNQTLYDYKCNGTKYNTLYVQIVVSNATSFIQLQATSYNKLADFWNTTNTDFKVTTNNTYNQTFTRNVNCESLLSGHNCKSKIPDFYTIKERREQEFDTLKHANYLIVNSNAKGIININVYNIQNYSYYVKFIVFEGDISSNCNLNKIFESNTKANNFSFCAESKTYTILIVHAFNVNQLKINITQSGYSNNINHFHHTNVHEMGNFEPGTELYSRTLNSAEKDSIVQIKNFAKTGRFIFQDFYLNRASTIIISESSGCSRYNYFIFKNRFQNNTIDTITGIDYQRQGGYDRCKIFKEGFYTIISYFDTTGSRTLTPCKLPNSCFRIVSAFVCPANTTNNQPNKTLRINNNLDVLSNNANNIGINYIYNVPFCIDCSSKSTSISPIFVCKSKQYLIDHEYTPTYFSFYLGSNAEIQLLHQSFLFRGDINTNLQLCMDSNNLIDPCSHGNIYCNLEGGKFYTIVYWSGRFPHPYKFMATPHRISINDHAKNAYNLGHVLNNSSISPAIPITCHTTAAFSDPRPKPGNGHHIYDRYIYPIPYKDTLNKLRIIERRNLWYTFTTSGAGQISAEINTINKCSARILIYRYTKPYSQIFDNNFDSTLNSLEEIAINGSNSSCFHDFVRFQNFGCDNNRYFILIENQNTINSEFTLRITQNPNNVPTNAGNFCTNAISRTISLLGTHVLQGFNNCHNYGGSPFEEENSNIKSTWFELNVINVSRFDFGIKYTGSAKLLNYNIYGGDCNNLIKIANLRNANSFISLSCMGLGKIYIQAISESSMSGLLSFEAVLKTPNINCKPFDFKQPIAQFDFSGGCSDDTLICINKSNQGTNIIYKWYVNNILYRTNKNPKLFITDPQFTRNNTIKLVVINILDNLKDSMEKTFIKRDFNYSFKIKNPGPFNCYDTLKMEVNTNFPEKLNYEWFGFNYPNKYNILQKVYGQVQYFIKVNATNNNCFFSDSIELKVKKPNLFFSDSLLCNGNFIILNPDTFDYFIINNFQVFQKYEITTSGKYKLNFRYKGCDYFETLNASITNKIDTIIKKDTINVCNSQVIEIKPTIKLLNYRWDNGDTSNSILVYVPKVYELKGSINKCKTLFQNFTVIKDSVPEKFLKDTSLCQNDIYYFKSPITAIPILSKLPNMDSFIILHDTKIKMTLGINNCIKPDSALIKVIYNPHIFKDTIICYNENFQFLRLDAGDAKTYNWLGQQNFTQFLNSDEYKTFKNARVNWNNCKDTISFNIKQDCPLNVFFPNAFSPNDDNFNNFFNVSIKGNYDNYKYIIFNRWGEIIFKANNGENWYGTYLNEKVQEGVYGVSISVLSKGKWFKFSGTITLLY